MTLVIIETLQPWDGRSPIGDVTYQANIEQLWKPEDLAAIGLTAALPFVPVAGKIPTGDPIYVKNADGTVSTTFALVDIPPADLSAYASAKRFDVETGGITVNGAAVATDRDSQAMISNAYAYMTASGAASVSYKAVSGFVTLDAATLKAIALAVGAHVQTCFATEDNVDAAITGGTITTTAQIDAAFAAPA